jgi:hypothetical protein
MIHRMAMVVALTVLCAFATVAGQEARAQGAAQQLLPSASPEDAASPPAGTPQGRKSRHEAHGGNTHGTAGGTLIQGGDTVSLIATLPWWRVDQTRPPDPGSLESPILTASDLWLGFPFATGDAKSLTVRLAAAQHASEIDQVANQIEVADPSELNAIDQEAPAQPQGGAGSWLSALLALVAGGAVAAFSAARYFFA